MDVSQWRRLIRVLTVCAAVLCVGYLVALPVGLVAQERRLGAAELALAGGLVLVGVACSQNTYGIKDFTVGTGGISARLESLGDRQRRVEDNVAALRVAVAGLVTKFEDAHLNGLAARTPVVVKFNNHMVGELTRLDAIDFVRPTDPRGLNAIREDHGDDQDDFDLKRYVEITEKGLHYLAIRATLSETSAPSVRSS
jgi:hypothetical protein